MEGVHLPTGRERTGTPASLVVPATVVIVASFVVRVVLIDRQSYWIDELFSVDESAGTVAHLLTAGSTEVHPPLYAALLQGWMRLGGPAGTHEVWTRLFSTGCAVLAVVATHRGLRPVRLGGEVRWALTTATAAGGASIVYSQEARSYALLLAAAAGLTAATVRAAVAEDGAGPRDRWRDRVAWTGWSLLAATTHLFGAVLTAGAVTVLVGARLQRTGSVRAVARTAAGRAALGAAGCSLQALWLLAGIDRAGFAATTSWIPAPTPADLGTLLTSTFASGGLALHRDGFAWTSPVGAALAAVAVVAAVALLLAHRVPRRSRGDRADSADGADVGRAAAVLLALAAVVVVAAFLGSQDRHLWTLRNLLVVTPALTWGVVCLAAAAAGSATGRRGVAAAVIGLLGIGLVPVATDLARPYKTDFRGLVEQLAAVRAGRPGTAVAVIGTLPPATWRATGDARSGQLYREMTPQEVASPDAVARTAGPQVVVIYRRLLDPDLDGDVAALVTRLGPGCERVRLLGVGLVRCR